MFAPEGYETFSRIYHAIWERAAAATPLISSVKATKDILKERHQLCEWMIAEYFATGPSFFVASPEGKVMHVAPEIGFYADEPQVVETYKGHLFLNADTWTVDIKRLEDRTRAANALFEEMRGNLKLADQCSELAWVDRMARCGAAFRHFQGWALVVRSDDLKPIGEMSFECLDEIEQKNEGEPPLSDEQLVASMILEYRENPRITKPELKDRLAPYMTQTRWRELLNTAAEQEQGLSKRGPKPRLP